MVLTLMIKDALDFLQCGIVHTVGVLNAVAQIHGDLFPSGEAEIPLFQNGLMLGIRDCFYNLHNFTLQIHQAVNISIDLCL